MAAKQRFKVLRRHEGDRMYEEGEVREGALSDLKHLIPNVLQPIDEGAKAEERPANKAEPAPDNKADGGRNRKRNED